MKIQDETKKMIRIYDRQSGKCPYTGLPLKPFIQFGLVSIDHIQPTSKGGSNEEHNQALVPEFVNTMKGAMDTEDFIKYLSTNKLPVVDSSLINE